ncbi:NPCBM/NEW2 domain-containing protein [Uliginosibacterium sediminicola]|uniref:NPCBM/NEW2 domain-containing protein n=1 Tax=Uliginosibacterium sediminicola TaxID=2024550 RepID=A0ABU9YUI5_9RHOO
MGVWIVLCVLLNVLLSTSNGFGGDINDWVLWSKHLQTSGYAGLPANYPPVYVHWLWVIGCFASALHISIQPDLLLRLLVNAPDMLAQLGVLWVMARLLRAVSVTDCQWHALIALAACNPAIFMDGPLWGQVDMMFCLPLVIALVVLIEGCNLIAFFSLATLALLTKFQAICVAPVVLPLLWHQRRSRALWLGLLPAAALGALLMLPYILAGSAGSMFSATYLKAASLFPVATFNGFNLWFLLGLNTRPDGIFLLDYALTPQTWQILLTPKWLGIGLCALWDLMLLISSWRRNEPSLHWRNFYLAATGFFLFLPGMHERYLLPAVVIALAAAALDMRRHGVAAVLLSFGAAANMFLVSPPSGFLLPHLVAALLLGLALVVVLQDHLARLPWQRVLSLPGWFWGAAAAVIWLSALCIHVARVMPDRHGWLDVTTMPVAVTQGWGALQVNTSVSGERLSVNKQRYEHGFGTHAPSSIRISIPPGALAFDVQVGMDDESRGHAEFILMVDDDVVWQSGAMDTGDTPRSKLIDVKGKKTLELVVDPLGSNEGDHADWLQPRFRVVEH